MEDRSARDVIAEVRSAMPRPSGGFVALLMLAILIGFAFVAGPWFIPEEMIGGGAQKSIMLVFGIGLMLVSAILLIVTKLVIKAKPNVAFVRTGLGGARVIKNGGGLYIPVIHELTPVPLEGLKLLVERVREQMVQTSDPLFVDVEAACFVQVEGDDDAIKNAAQTLGARLLNETALKSYVTDMLDGTIRAVATSKTFDQANEGREEFSREVREKVAEDLKKAGLTLKAFSINRYTQVPSDRVKSTDSPIHARVHRFMTEKTAEETVKANEAQLAAEQAIKQRQVDTARAIAAQEVEQAQAVAEAEANKQIASAEAKRKAAEFAAEQDRLAGEAQAKSDRAVRVAKAATEQAVAIAEAEKAKAAETADIARQEAVEVATRKREAAIAAAEAERAEAEAKAQLAEKEKIEATQAALTAEAVATAEREKRRAVIAKEAEAAQRKIEEQAKADVAAYTVVAQATGEQDAAEKRASAQIRLAEAARQAAVLEAQGAAEAAAKRAEGERAVQMVPVEVSREQVTVKDAEVAVETKRLEAQSAHAAIASDLQISLARIAADKEARIAQAQAMGNALSQAEIRMVSDPDGMNRILNAISTGQQMGEFANEVVNGMPEELKNLSGTLGTAGVATLLKLVQKIGGVDAATKLLGSAAGNGAATPEHAAVNTSPNEPAAAPAVSAGRRARGGSGISSD